MIPFLFILLQLVLTGIAIFVFKIILDRELEQAAIEKVMSLKINPDVKVIKIYSAGNVPSKVKQQLDSIVKNKFTNGQLVYEEIRSLKGGLMVKVEEEILDFSLSSRLESLWS